MSQAFYVVRTLQCLGVLVEFFLENGSLLGKALVSRPDGFVKAQDVAPVVVRTRIMVVLNGTVKGKIETADLGEVVSLHVGGNAGRSRIGVVHAIEVFDRVFDHTRFLGQDISQEGFHDRNLVLLAFVWKTIFEGGDEFHGKVGILGVRA